MGEQKYLSNSIHNYYFILLLIHLNKFILNLNFLFILRLIYLFGYELDINWIYFWIIQNEFWIGFWLDPGLGWTKSIHP